MFCCMFWRVIPAAPVTAKSIKDGGVKPNFTVSTTDGVATYVYELPLQAEPKFDEITVIVSLEFVEK